MRILFDHGTPAPLRQALRDHNISTAYEMGWTGLDNGALLREAEADFDALITTDRSLRFQQNLGGRALPTTSWPKIQAHLTRVAAAVNGLHPGDVVELDFPSR